MGIPRPAVVSTKRARVAELAKQMPGMVLTSLSHHIDMEWMREAYRLTRKDGATGIDGQDARVFAERLEENLQELLDLAKSGRYRGPAVRRVSDGVVTRLVGKWLNAGVMESGQLSYPEAGTPQGGVISPLLANIYLHEVLDLWFHEQVMPRLKGRAFLVRFADDAVLCFEREDDARRVLDVVPKRFGKYGLTLHPEKTRLIEFRRPSGNTGRKPRGGGPRPGSFDMLGFTHFWGQSRKGNWVIQRKTAKGRLSRALSSIARWCRRHRHLPIAEQHAQLTSKMRGHYAYYGISGNGRALSRFRHLVQGIWRKWLDRRVVG